jgi:hypothetical protein
MKKFILVAALLLCPRAGFSWGRQGHITVALVAQGLLAPRAQRLVEELRHAQGWEALKPGRSRGFDKADQELTLFCVGGSGDLSLVGDWADAWKGRHRPTGPLHYVNLPLDGAGASDLATACGSGCVVSQLREQLACLGDARRSQVERLEALLWVVHLVGDIHQPLHCADNGDAGGNDVTVTLGRKQESLHSAWDSGFFYAEHARPAELAAELLGKEARAQAAGPLDPGAWAAESWGVAKSFVYPQLQACDGRFGRGEEAAAWRVVRQQLARAGVRLAAALNAAASGGGKGD